jgi:hypothetical protein
LSGFASVAGGGGQFLTYPILSELMTAASAPGAPSYSVSYWINTTTTNQHQFTILSNWGNSASNPGRFTYVFGFNVAAGVPQMRGQTRFNTSVTGNGTDIFARPASTATLNDGSWHMLTWTFDTTSGQLISYFDGMQVDTFMSAAASLNMIQSSSTVGSFGLKGDDNTNPFINGSYSLDEAWVFQGVLTAGQISGLFSANNVGAAPAVTGDYNSNGVVDAADYTVWRDRFGQTFALAGENPTAATPGLVDQEDYDFWRARFGLTTGRGSVAGANATAPEPGTGVILIVGIVSICSRRRAAVP